VLQLALDEDGTDAEQPTAQLATGCSPRCRSRAPAETQADYVAWCLAQLGIAAAFCYPNRAGIGTVDVAALHSGSGTRASSTRRSQHAARGAAGTRTDAGYGPGPARADDRRGDGERRAHDHDDGRRSTRSTGTTRGPLTVLAWTAGTRTLQFSAAAAGRHGRRRPDRLQGRRELAGRHAVQDRIALEHRRGRPRDSADRCAGRDRPRLRRRPADVDDSRRDPRAHQRRHALRRRERPAAGRRSPAAR
jgi:hypothetical protein